MCGSCLTVNLNMLTRFMYTLTHINSCIHLYINSCIHLHMYNTQYTHNKTHPHMCISTIYIYIYIYIYTYIHTYIHVTYGKRSGRIVSWCKSAMSWEESMDLPDATLMFACLQPDSLLNISPRASTICESVCALHIYTYVDTHIHKAHKHENTLSNTSNDSCEFACALPTPKHLHWKMIIPNAYLVLGFVLKLI